MEIRDYLRAIRRWLWLPIVVPLLAGLITGGLLEMQPSKYQANATVIVPAVTAKGFSTSAAAQYAVTFEDVLVSTPVVDKVAAKYHVPIQDLVAGLSASTTTASSNIIHVVYLGYRGQNTTGIVDDATVVSLDAIAEPQLVQAQNAVSAGQVQLEQANAAINNFNATTGSVDLSDNDNECSRGGGPRRCRSKRRTRPGRQPLRLGRAESPRHQHT